MTEIFTSNLTGLSALTTYYVRAYATTLAGTSYGTEQTFTTLNAAPAFSYASPTQTLVTGVAIATPIALTVTGGVPDKAQVSRLAGSGSAMFINGKGTAAAFSSPFGVWADATENLYVSEAGNHRIRKYELG